MESTDIKNNTGQTPQGQFINRDDWLYYNKTKHENAVVEYTCPWKNSSKKKYQLLFIIIPLVLHLIVFLILTSISFIPFSDVPGARGSVRYDFMIYDFLFITAVMYFIGIIVFIKYSFNRRSPEVLEELLITGMSKGEIAFGALEWPKYLYKLSAKTLFYSSIILFCFSFNIFKYGLNYWIRTLLYFISLLSIILISYSAFIKSFYISRGNRVTFFLLSTFMHGILFLTIAPILSSLRNQSFFWCPYPAYALFLTLYTQSKNVDLFFSKVKTDGRQYYWFLNEILFWVHPEKECQLRTISAKINDLFFGMIIPLAAFWLAYYIFVPFQYHILQSVRGMKFYNNSLHWRVMYCFLPLVFWAIGALAFIFFRSKPVSNLWIKYGLIGGIITSSIFSMQFIPLLPSAALGVLYFGIGLLGFSPFLALGIYSIALWRYCSSEKRQASPDSNEFARVLPLYFIILLLFVCSAAAYYFIIHIDNFPMSDLRLF